MRARRAVAALAVFVVLLSGCSASDPSKLNLPSHVRAYFFGDSLTQGYSATPGHGFVELTVRHFGWTLVRSPDGSGSGFVHSYPGSAGTFPTRAAALPKHINANLIVIEGGVNDVGFALTGYSRAVDETIAALRARIGQVPIVIVGPPAHARRRDHRSDDRASRQPWTCPFRNSL